MKNSISIKIIFTLIILSISFISVNAQEKGEKLIELVKSQDFKFVTINATSQGGRNIQLNGQYELKIIKDSLSSYLPFYGRAYVAPIDPTKSGIMFDTKDFDYKNTERGKKGWRILISPKQITEARKMNLEISTGGYATLVVFSDNRAPMTFYGYITANEKKEKK